MIFRQLFDPESSTYTYILASQKEAVIIDPVLETQERDLKLLTEMGVKLKYILETHVHADHVTSAYYLNLSTHAKIGAGIGTGLNHADILLKDEDTIQVGDLKIRAIATPGHTSGCTSYYVEDRVFTGDTLMIRACGRTDFQGGSTDLLFQSVREKLFKLPDATFVYPAHDYNGMTSSTIGEEKAHNPRLGIQHSKEHFVNVMNHLNLAYPKKIDMALPRNQRLGKE